MKRIGSVIGLLLVLCPWIGYAKMIQTRVLLNGKPWQPNQEIAISDEQVLQLTVEVSSDHNPRVEAPQLSGLKNLQLRRTSSDSNVQTSLTLVNGDPSFVKQTNQRFHFFLLAEKRGEASVGKVEVSVDGNLESFGPIPVKVVEASSAQPLQPARPDEEDPLDPLSLMRRQFFNAFPDEDIFDQLMRQEQLRRSGNEGREGWYRSQPKNQRDAFFIQLELDKTEAYEGEQILANWYILSRGPVEKLERLKFPNLKGFWKEDIDAAPQARFVREVFGGVPYYKALLASYALFPIQAGDVKIDDYKIKATVRLPTNSNGGLFGMGSKAYSYTRPSEQFKLKVKELPKDNQPKTYTGGVGQFSMRAEVDPGPYKQGRTLKYTLLIEGKGNPKLIDPPQFEFGEAFEVYSQLAQSAFNPFGMSQRKVELVLIPKKAGEVELPPVELSFFDPDQGEYKTLKTDLIRMRVESDPNYNASQSLANSNRAEQLKNSSPSDDFEESSVQPILQLSPWLKAQAWAQEHSPSRGSLWILLSSSLALGLVVFLYSLRASRQEINYELLIRERFRDYKRGMQKQKPGEVSARAAFFLQKLVARFSANRESSEFEDVVSGLSPQLRERFEAPVRDLYKDLIDLAYAPKTSVQAKELKSEESRLIQSVEVKLFEFIRAARP